MPGVLSDSGSATQAGGPGGRRVGGAEKGSEPGGRAGESGERATVSLQQVLHGTRQWSHRFERPALD